MHEFEVRVPDIGDFETVDVVEILVAPGDRVAVEDPLVSLESDKATMEVPSPVAGEVLAVKVSLGDAVSEGSLLVVVAASEVQDAPAVPAPGSGVLAPPELPKAGEPPAPAAPPLARFAHPPAAAPAAPAAPGIDGPVRAHAGPAMRRFARELGVDLAGVEGSGPHGRVLETDLKRHVRETFASGGARVTVGTAGFARRADVTDLEAWRRRIPMPKGETVPPTAAVVLKAALAALRAFPELLDPAAAAPLVVAVDGAAGSEEAGPVSIAHADVLGVREIAQALQTRSEAAAAEARFRLTCSLARGGRSPHPVRGARQRFALAIGPVEVVPRWTGSPDDALAAESMAGFEPGLSLPIAIDVAPDVAPEVADRFLDHWAEILSAPARLLL